MSKSLETIQWLSSHNVKFEPIYSRQSFLKDGKHIFWGGLTLAAENEGVGLFNQELAAFLSLGGKIFYESPVTNLLLKENKVTGIYVGDKKIEADAVILASGGFEANNNLRKSFIGDNWLKAKVRGTPHNTGDSDDGFGNWSYKTWFIWRLSCNSNGSSYEKLWWIRFGTKGTKKLS